VTSPLGDAREAARRLRSAQATPWVEKKALQRDLERVTRPSHNRCAGPGGLPSSFVLRPTAKLHELVQETDAICPLACAWAPEVFDSPWSSANPPGRREDDLPSSVAHRSAPRSSRGWMARVSDKPGCARRDPRTERSLRARHWRNVSVGLIEPGVVESAEVLHDGELHLRSGAPDAVGDQLGLGAVEEAFGQGDLSGVADRPDRLQHAAVVERLSVILMLVYRLPRSLCARTRRRHPRPACQGQNHRIKASVKPGVAQLHPEEVVGV
jgi:hypothetical protein